MILLDRLQKVEARYHELSEQMADPAIAANYEQMSKLAQEQSGLEPLVSNYRTYNDVVSRMTENREIIAGNEDAELTELAQEENLELQAAAGKLEEELKVLLLPKDPQDEKDVIVEIRAGAGGDEAALFCADLYRMYSRWAEDKRFKQEVLSLGSNGLGGIKEVIFAVKGKQIYSQLKYESGVHRVQRVPETESQGRIHTSTATVAILPEADDVEIAIAPQDVRIDIMRSSGPGGQSVNTTDSAVRITHLPTGLVVSCQDEKSQLQNRLKAMRILRTRLFNMETQRRQDELGASRRSQVGSGDRSEKIRTYNFPQGRVTDHRINLTLYQLTGIIDGKIDEFIEGLTTAEQAAQLADLGA